MTSGREISHKLGSILFALNVFYAAVAFAGHGVEDTIDMLAAERVKQLMDAGEKLTFIDLRPAKEFQQTRLPGARSIPIAEMASRYGEIPKTGRVILYCDCKTYDISDRAVFLEYRGYRNIFVMPEGYSGWVKRGYPLDGNRR
ncbi:MAG TPA: rhodanese-like domain-containing protein [Candidatus Saccharimonadales bacterium]|nr:rhodanese-like domain-containing protein [Candidatus Saccharimonadales bacterium]